MLLMDIGQLYSVVHKDRVPITSMGGKFGDKLGQILGTQLCLAGNLNPSQPHTTGQGLSLISWGKMN